MSVAAEQISEEHFLACVAAIGAAAPTLSPLAASILLAAHFGVCSDSRTFARIFGIEHALVLREVTELADRVLITAPDPKARTQRTHFALTDAATTLLRAALPNPPG
jgi:hypothetical protein